VWERWRELCWGFVQNVFSLSSQYIKSDLYANVWSAFQILLFSRNIKKQLRELNNNNGFQQWILKGLFDILSLVSHRSDTLKTVVLHAFKVKFWSKIPKSFWSENLVEDIFHGIILSHNFVNNILHICTFRNYYNGPMWKH